MTPREELYQKLAAYWTRERASEVDIADDICAATGHMVHVGIGLDGAGISFAILATLKDEQVLLVARSLGVA